MIEGEIGQMGRIYVCEDLLSKSHHWRPKHKSNLVKFSQFMWFTYPSTVETQNTIDEMPHVCLHSHSLKFNPDMCITMVDNIYLENLEIIDLTVTWTDFMCHFEQGCKLDLQRLTCQGQTLTSAVNSELKAVLKRADPLNPSTSARLYF